MCFGSFAFLSLLFFWYGAVERKREREKGRKGEREKGRKGERERGGREEGERRERGGREEGERRERGGREEGEEGEEIAEGEERRERKRRRDYLTTTSGLDYCTILLETNNSMESFYHYVCHYNLLLSLLFLSFDHPRVLIVIIQILL